MLPTLLNLLANQFFGKKSCGNLFDHTLPCDSTTRLAREPQRRKRYARTSRSRQPGRVPSSLHSITPSLMYLWSPPASCHCNNTYTYCTYMYHADVDRSSSSPSCGLSLSSSLLPSSSASGSSPSTSSSSPPRPPGVRVRWTPPRSSEVKGGGFHPRLRAKTIIGIGDAPCS